MFECPICYQNRRKVITLQCNHTICQSCWKKWSKKELDYFDKRWPTCPCCRDPQKPWYLREENQQLIVFVCMFVLFWFTYRSQEAGPIGPVVD